MVLFLPLFELQILVRNSLEKQTNVKLLKKNLQDFRPNNHSWLQYYCLQGYIGISGLPLIYFIFQVMLIF